MGLIRTMRLLGAAALLLLALLGTGGAAARTVLELDTAQQPVPLLDWGDAWIDSSGQLRAEDVSADPSIVWRPTSAQAVYPLGTGRNLWIRFTVPPAPDAERWYLEIPYPAVNRVTLYTLDSILRWQPAVAGDTIPVASWPVPHRHPLLPIAVSAEAPQRFMLKIENPQSFGVPLQFVSESHLGRHGQRTSLVLGIYFGLAALAVILGLLSSVTLRDSAFGWYALGVGLMALTQATLTGVAGLHLWPHLAWWNDNAAFILPTLAIGALVWFLAVVVSLPERSRPLKLLFATAALACAPVAAGVMLVEPSYRIGLLVPYVVANAALAIAGLAWAARRGDRYAWALLCGSLPVIVGASFPVARVAGLIPIGFWTTHGMQVGIAMELPIMLLVLMLRSQQRRENRRRIVGIERIDPATGLINAQVFQERAQQMITRALRLKYRVSILLVDIANVEQVRRKFNPAAADELPLRVAGRLLSTAREIDSVARLSDHRFGLLMEGPLTEEDVLAAGPRVVARCLMPFENRPQDWVAQVRVAQAVAPDDGVDAGRLVAQLHAVLATVPPDSRRAVFPLAKTGLAAVTS
jgi:diguanylate cyclase (GGDEF)-like protein